MRSVMITVLLLCASPVMAQELLPGSIHAEQLEPMPLPGPWHWTYKPSPLADRLMLGMSIADCLSTLQARLVLEERFREQNAVMNNPLRFIAIKVGVTTAINLWAHHLRAEGHKTQANIAQWVGIGLTGSIVAFNEVTIARARR